MTTGTPARSVDGLDRALRAASCGDDELAPPDVAARLLRLLIPALDADGGALLLMDPHTGLFWTGAVDRLPAASCHPFFASELDSEDRRTFRRLARDGAPASALSLRGDESGTFRATVLEPSGFGDEVRVVARDAGVAWGALSLWRKQAAGPFGEQHERLLDGVAPQVGAALRDAVLRSLSTSAAAPVVQGALVIEGGVVTEASPEARRLMRELDDPGLEHYRQADHLLALSRRRSRFSVVLGSRDGGWVTAHGTALSDTRTVVLLSAPSPADLLGAVVAGAGLTAREIEVTRLVCRGLSDAEIARELRISPHTAHDHVRAVRAKLGVRSRAEVASRVFADRYLDRFLASASVAHED